MENTNKDYSIKYRDDGSYNKIIDNEDGSKSITYYDKDDKVIGVGGIGKTTTISLPIRDIYNADVGDVQKIAASQIALLDGYYNLVMNQSKRSFYWALVAAAIGLIFFIGAITFILAYQSKEASIVSLISGALVEVISGVNFYLYGKVSQQLSEFHKTLDITQRYLLANSICEGLSEEKRDETRAMLIGEIVSLKSFSSNIQANLT